MKTTCHYNKIISILEHLHTTHPSYTMGKHLATALDGSGDLFMLTDHEIETALRAYSAELAYDVPHKNEREELDVIVREGMRISSFTKEDFNMEDDEN